MKNDKSPKSYRWAWLFTVPLMVPLLVWITASIRPVKTVDGSLGKFNTNSEGEKRVLKSLIYRIENEPFDQANIDWLVVSPTTKNSYNMRSVCITTFVAKTLSTGFGILRKGKSRQADEVYYVYSEVDLNALRQAERQGKIEVLANSGATLKEATKSWPSELE